MTSDPLGLSVLAPSLGETLTSIIRDRTVLMYYTFQNLDMGWGWGKKHCPGQIIPLGIVLEVS